ncbi:MAG: lamin tail domain-containing protein, partial [Pedobacter sp.]
MKADSIRRTSDSTLYVFFNKSIILKSIIPGNFSLSPAAGKIKNIIEDIKHERLKITFTERFTAGKTYELDISDVKDCSGNGISNHTRFSFSLPPLPPPPAEKPDTAMVLITEIFADPSPEVRLPLVEFIELYNPGRDTVNLEGWTISDTQTKSTLKKFLIVPKQYLILCPIADTTLLKSYGKTAGISPWPALGNNEDLIFLRSFKNRMVDSVSYSDSWYKNPDKKPGGWSLEIIDLSSKTCPAFYNWAASIDPAGGTPGRTNSRYLSGYLDEALKIDSAKVLSDSTAAMFFNRIPDKNFLKASNFQITNGMGKAKSLSIRPDFMGIILEFNQKFREGVEYILSADSLYSCSGTLNSSSNRQISFSIPVVPENDYPLIINEIFADPSPVNGLPEVEFVELFNPTQNTVNLKDLNFGDQISNYSLKNGEIAAGSYIILCAEKDTAVFKPFGKVIGLAVWPDLNNETDVLLLKSNKGRELHQVRYDSGWYKDAEKRKGGYSLELIDPMSICLSFQNWTASRDSSGGTPGSKNSVYQADYKPETLKLTGVELIDSLSISLSFNRAVDHLKAMKSSNYTLNNGAGSPMSSRLAEIYFDKVILTLKDPLTRGQTYRIRVNDISDCRNTPISAEFSSLEFTLSKKIEKNDILITEILFNPRPEGADFVEIYNNSSQSLDLKDLSIARIIKDS